MGKRLIIAAIVIALGAGVSYFRGDLILRAASSLGLMDRPVAARNTLAKAKELAKPTPAQEAASRLAEPNPAGTTNPNSAATTGKTRSGRVREARSSGEQEGIRHGEDRESGPVCQGSELAGSGQRGEARRVHRRREARKPGSRGSEARVARSATGAGHRPGQGTGGGSGGHGRAFGERRHVVRARPRGVHGGDLHGGERLRGRAVPRSHGQALGLGA